MTMSWFVYDSINMSWFVCYSINMSWFVCDSINMSWFVYDSINMSWFVTSYIWYIQISLCCKMNLYVMCCITGEVYHGRYG